jgi:hypothetical protein
MRVTEFVENYIAELSITTTKGIDKVETYRNIDIYVTAEKFKDKYYIAYAVRPRDRKEIDKQRGDTQEEAIDNLKASLDKRESEKPRVSGQATVDFNVAFARLLLTDPRETFYAKIAPGPKLIIANEEFYDMPELLRGEGFSKSGIRNPRSADDATKLPAIPLRPAQAQAADIIANGRYLIGNESTDSDGHRVFELIFDSVVSDPGERMLIRKPALTIGTQR